MLVVVQRLHGREEQNLLWTDGTPAIPARSSPRQ